MASNVSGLVVALIFSVLAHGSAAWATEQPEQKPNATPLDRLKADDIPAAERFLWQPKELVGVYGSHAWHYWSYPSHAWFPLHMTTDGKQLTVFQRAQGGDAIYIFDGATGKDRGIFRLPKGGPVYGVGFSAGGKLVALYEEKQFDWSGVVWDVAGKKIVYRIGGKGSAPSEVFFSPNGKMLAAVGFDQGPLSGIQFYDLPTGKHLFAAPQNHATRPKFHPNGTRAYYTVSGPGEDGVHVTSAYEWDLSKRAEKQLFQRRDYAVSSGHQNNGLALAPDGRWLAVPMHASGFAKPEVQLWNLTLNKAGARIPMPGMAVALAFSPDDKSLAITRPNGSVGLYERGSGKEYHALNANAPQYKGDNLFTPAHLTFSPDGKFLAAASFVDSRLLLWEVATGKAVHEDTDWANGLAISPDSRTLLLETRHGPLAGLHLLDLTTGKRRTIAELDKERIGPGVFSPNGKIAVVLGNNRAWTIDTETAKIVPGVQVDGGTFAIFFTPDGKHLVATSHKTIVRYETANWTATRKEFVWNFSPGWPGAVALSQDGKILAADTTENIKIIDLTKMEIVRSFDRDQPGLLAISRDGTKLAHANQSGGTAEVWNITSGDKLYDFKGHRNYLTGLCFDRSGNTLFTAGADGRLIRWISGNSKKEWQFPGLVRSIQLTPEGRHLMVNNGNGTVYLLRVDELE